MSVTPLTLRDFGYAPGNYSCMCCSCGEEFIGDKRAIQCEGCATMKLRRSEAQPAADTIAKPQGSIASKDVGIPEVYAWVREQFGGRFPSMDEIARAFYEHAHETSDELTVKFPRAWAPYLQAVILGATGDMDGDGDCRWHLNELAKFLGKAPEKQCECGPSDLHMECPIHGASRVKTSPEGPL